MLAPDWDALEIGAAILAVLIFVIMTITSVWVLA